MQQKLEPAPSAREECLFCEISLNQLLDVGSRKAEEILYFPGPHALYPAWKDPHVLAGDPGSEEMGGRPKLAGDCFVETPEKGTRVGRVKL
jgi:hypothetical protein